MLNLIKNLSNRLVLNPWKVLLIKKGKLKYIITAVSRIYPLGITQVNDRFHVKILSRKLIQITRSHQFEMMDDPKTTLDKKDILKFSGYEHFYELYKALTRNRGSMVYESEIRWLYEIEPHELKVGDLV